MKKREKIIFIIILALILPFIIQNNNVHAESINDLKNQFPNGSRWYGDWHKDIECAGFARMMYEKYYGLDPKSWGNMEKNDVYQIGAGDIVRYNNHSIWVLSRNGDKITFADCNSDWNCIVRWDAQMYISWITNFEYIIKAPYPIGGSPATNIDAPSTVSVDTTSAVRINWSTCKQGIGYLIRIYNYDTNEIVKEFTVKKIGMDSIAVYDLNTGKYKLRIYGKGMNNVLSTGYAETSFSCNAVASGYTLTPEKLMIEVGKSKQYMVKLKPEGSFGSYSFSAGPKTDTSIISVENDGTITGLKEGKTWVQMSHVFAQTQGYQAYPVYVVNGINFAQNTKDLRVGDTYKIKTTSMPTNSEVTWGSNNKKVATVDSNGNITAVGPGEATIYATSTIKCDEDKYVYTISRDSCTVSVREPDVLVTDLSLNKSNVEIMLGRTETLTATVTPTNATNKNVEWSSSNESIATVDNGVVKSISCGDCVITAKCGNYTKTCNIKVYEAKFENKFLKLEKSSFISYDEELYTAELTNGDTAKVSLKSNNSNVEIGGSKIYGVSGGFATITGHDEKYGDLTYICFVNDKIQLSDGSYKFVGDLNDNERFDSEDVSLIKDNINNGNLSNDNKKLCDINGDGQYNSEDIDLLKSIVNKKLITVEDVQVEEIVTMESSEETNYGTLVYYVAATVRPASASGCHLDYKSSNPTIATIDDYGEITVYKAGKVTFTVTAPNGIYATQTYNFTDLDITNKIHIFSINLDRSNVILSKDENIKINATISPKNTDDSKTITWKSSDENIATVDSNGNVMAVGTGTVTITAETVNGKKAVCNLEVVQPMEDFSLEKSEVTVSKAEKEYIIIGKEFKPIDTTESKNIIWQSSDENVAKVIDDKVYLYDEGTSIITAITENGLTSSCVVNVTDNDFAVGDVNGDGKVNAGDYVAILNYVRKKIDFTDEQLQRADVNRDGKVNAGDYVAILNYVRGKITLTNE